MERLIQVVQREKADRQALLRKIYEDYINKARYKLAEFFEKRADKNTEIYMATFYSVGIADINFKEGTVEVEDVWYTDDVSELDSPFSELDAVDGTVLKSQFWNQEILDFLSLLGDEGYEFVLFFTDDDFYKNKYPLYPFFRVE